MTCLSQRFVFYPGWSVLAFNCLLQVKTLESDVRLALAVLRRRINPCESPIYRLHPEILSLIASDLATDDLVTMSHVSHHWRTVLLSYSSVWSILDFTHIERASAFLARSRSAPIRVFLYEATENIPLTLELLNQSADRITTLSLGDYTSQKELLLRAAPSLKTLLFYPEHGGVLNETATLFFPTLETLFVESIDYLPFSAPQLTRFGFDGPSGCKEQAADALLEFLSNCPLLEDLEICRGADFYTRRNHDTVHLPHLRTYTHSSGEDFYLGLYKMLSFPPSCSVTFCCNGRAYGSVGSVLPFHKSPFFVDARRVKFKTGDIIAGDTHWEDYVEGVVEIIDAAHRRARSGRQVVVEDLTLEQILIDIINPLYPDFLEDLDPRFVEIFCVEGHALWFYQEVERVEEALDHLKHIRKLILSNSVVAPYLRALSPTEATDVSDWRCLELDTLVVHSRSRADRDGDDILCPLLSFARDRKAAGLPLRMVSLSCDSEWNLEDSELEELKRCIGTFEFVTGDDALDWKVDDYFLAGLDHLLRD